MTTFSTLAADGLRALFDRAGRTGVLGHKRRNTRSSDGPQTGQSSENEKTNE